MDPLASKTVRICKGQWKGYIGIVKDVTETHVRIELHMQNRTVNVAKDGVIDVGKDGKAATPMYSNTFGSTMSSGFDGGKTPAYESGLGAATPNPYASGAKSSAWDSGSKTPAWDAGSKTPAWDAGSKTPAWDAGSKTPTWEGRTPGSYRDTDSRATPGAWNTNVTTPSANYNHAFNANSSVDTPGDHNVPTPAPITPYPQTPAGYPQTPLGYPQTPAGYPQTPAGYPSTPGMQPQTPSAGIPSTPAAYPSGKFLIL
jgi:transcription elongation factor SPT5